MGFLAAAGAMLLVAPQAAADPRGDADDAIGKLAEQIHKGQADRGQAGAGLGPKQGGLIPAGDGFEQKFGGGAVFWSEKTGAKVLYGAILDKFHAEKGPTGTLGFPVSNEGPADFRPAGRVAEFAAADRPKIFWTPANGAWVVRGPMTAATDKLGRALGAPAGAMTTRGDEVSQRFANGSLTFNTATREWKSMPNAQWAKSLTGIAIPGLPDADKPDANAPDVNAPSVDATAPNATAPSVAASGPDSTAVGGDSDGFNWWWLIIPFLIVLLGLLVAWLWRNLKKPTEKAPDSYLRGPAIGPDGSTTAPKTGPRIADTSAPDLKTSTTGTAAAAAAGAAAAGAAMKGRHTGDAADATVAPDAASAATVAAAGGVRHGSGDGIGTYVKAGVEMPVPVGAHLPLDDPAEAPDGYPIKGVAESGLFHTSDQSSYDEVTPEIWFATESAAEAAGFRKADSAE